MKKIGLLFLLLSLSFFVTACGQTPANNSNNNNQEMGNRRPDFGQPDKEADVSGLVKSVTGNEVTIIKIDRPSGAGRNASSTGENGNPDRPSGENSGNRMGAMISGGSGARSGGPGFAGGGRAPGRDDEASRAERLEQLKKMSSGEAVVTIPVGIQMLKPDAAGAKGQPAMIEATLSDIKADKMISIWVDDSVTDRKIASFVLVMQ